MVKDILETAGRAAKDGDNYLDGQILIAMPSMEDERFARAVIFMCAHSEDGAMGIVLNHSADHIKFPDLLEQLDLTQDGPDPAVPDSAVHDVAVHVGGPVETGRGFVLHSTDYHSDENTLAIDDGVSLTATVDILRAIAAGNGPEQALLALGYAGWAPGQLEGEIQANGWLNCPATPALVFESRLDDKYVDALKTLGITPAHLVGDAGHA